MAEWKFTPGPWEATFREPGVEGVEIAFDIDRADGESIVRGQSAEHLKIDGQKDDPILAAECKANARLIAAAPDLLAALKVARQFMSIASDWNIDEAEIDGEMRSTYDWLEVVNAAIAKALGEQA